MELQRRGEEGKKLGGGEGGGGAAVSLLEKLKKKKWGENGDRKWVEPSHPLFWEMEEMNSKKALGLEWGGSASLALGMGEMLIKKMEKK